MAVMVSAVSRWWAGVLFMTLACALAAAAQAGDGGFDDDALALVTRLQQAAHGLDYAGIFIYQQGQTVLSSQIAHVADEAGERQRIEVLDGRMRREFLRHNDEVQSLFPELRLVLVEHRRTEHFPVFFVGEAGALAEYYTIEMEPEPGRVAGRPCRIAYLDPRDALRWGYRICVDEQSGLLLKAQTVDPDGDVLEQVAFSEVHIGEVDPALLESSHDMRGWRQVRADETVDLRAAGWHIAAPPGFKPISQVKRTLKHEKNVHQMVLSDGLAAISVFIETYKPERADAAGAVEHGATSVYSRQQDAFWRTVLGEVPAQTVRQVAEAIQYEPQGP